MNVALDLHSFMQSMVEHMLNGSFQGLAIAAFAVLGIRVAARKSAGTRFAVWFATLVTIAVLSFITFTATGTTVPHATGFSLPSAWSVYLFGLWAVGVVIGLVRVAIGLRQVSRLRRSSRPADIGALDPILLRALNDFRSTRAVTVRISDELRVPMAIGFFRPAVLLPAWTVKDLSPVELSAVVTHELAHLRRWDDWTKLAEKLISALLFFHPAVWWIQSQLGLEREIACDDLVLASLGDARSYAECLISVAERSRMRAGLALALAAISRVRQTSIRITKILDPNRAATKSASVWKPAAAMLSVLSAATLAAGPHVPTLVSFHDRMNVPAVTATSARTMPAVYTPESRPQILPAGLQLRTQPEPPTIPSSITTKRAPTKRVLMTTLKSRRQQPRTIRAGLNQSHTQPSTVLVVFESRHIDASGSSIWTLCVWRFAPEQKSATATEGIASKSI